SGELNVLAAGEVDIRVKYRDATGSSHLTVTTRAVRSTLKGTVTDAANGQPIADTRVEILDGVNAGRLSTTGADGLYLLPDLHNGTFVLRASRTGYDSLDTRVSLSADA